MTEQPVVCTQCGAPAAIRANQRFLRCEYCGNKFFLLRTPSHPIALEAFDDILKQRLDAGAMEAVQQRLASLEGEIGRQEREMVRKQRQLEAARSIEREARSQYGRAVAFGQNWTYVAGLVGVVAWFSSLFLLQSTERWFGIATAGLLTVVARGFHLDWSDASLGMQRRLDDARRLADRTERNLEEILLNVRDLQLERELCQRVSIRHMDMTAPTRQAAEQTR